MRSRQKREKDLKFERNHQEPDSCTDLTMQKGKEKEWEQAGAELCQAQLKFRFEV